MQSWKSSPARFMSSLRCFLCGFDHPRGGELIVALAACSGLFLGSASAADGTKADNTTDLNLSGSWVGGVLPDSGGWALWDTTLTAARSANLGADAIWGGIRSTATNKVTVGNTAGQTLTLAGLGGVGIDLTLANADFAIASALKLGSSQSFTVTNTRTLTVDGVLSDGGSGYVLTKDGGGTLALNGTNTYSGGTTLSGGTLTINNGGALGTGPLAVNLPSGGTFLTVANAAAVTLSNSISLPAPSSGQSYTLVKNMSISGNQLRFAGVISGGNSSATLFLNSGTSGDNSTTFRFDSANTFRATVNLNRGGLVLGHPQGFGNMANLIYLNANGNTTLGDLRFAISMTLTNPVQMVNATSPINTDTNTVALAGIVSGSVPLYKLGRGTLSLQGANTYTNTTSIGAGTLQMGGDGKLNGGTYVASIVNSGLFDYSSSAAQALNGVISGTGAVLKAGSATLTLNGTNTYSGGTTLAGGALTINNGSAFGTGTLTVSRPTGGTFLTVANTGAVTLANNIVLPAPASPQTYTLVKNSASQTNGMPLTFAGTLSGGGTNTTLLLDTPVGGDNSTTHRFAGTNTFRATVNLNRGALVVDNPQGFGDPANLIYLNGNGNLTLGDLRFSLPMTLPNPVQLVWTTSPINTDTNAVTLAGPVSGNKFTKLGSGALTLLGTNTYTGITEINAGTLRLGSAATLGAGLYAGNIANYGAFDVNSSAAQTLSGVISGTGAVFKTGSGTLIVSGQNTYTGATLITAGKWIGVTGGSCTNSAVALSAATASATLGLSVTDTAKLWCCTGLSVNGASAALEFAFGGLAPSASQAPLRVNGDLRFDATPAVAVSGWNLAPGTYPLVTWTGTLSGTAPTAVTLPPRFSGSLSVTGSTLSLTVTAVAQPLRWALPGSGAWDLNTSLSWKDSGGSATTYQETAAAGDSVIFDETYLAGSATVTLGTTVSPGSVTVNTSAKDIAIAGSGMIAGSGPLTKQGNGTLTLATLNTFSGGVTLGGGTLSVPTLANASQPCSLGAASAAAANLSLGGGGTLRYTGGSASSDRNFTLTAGGCTVDVASAGQTLTLTGSGTGNYPLTKTGAGPLVFTAANALSAAGNVTLASGELQVAAWNVGSGRTNTVAAGALLTSTGSLQIPAINSSPYSTLFAGTGTWRLRSAGTSVGTPDLFAPNNNLNLWGLQLTPTLDLGSAGTTRFICGYDQHCNPVTWNASNDGDLLLSGSLTGGADLYFFGYPYSGTEMAFMLNADNSGFSGTVTLARGDLFLNHAKALTATNAVALTPGANSNAVLRVWNRSVTIGSLSSSGAGSSQVAGSGPLASLTVWQSANGTFSGTLTQQNAQRVYTTGSALAFTKDGPATLTLAWTNGYVDRTTVLAGTLALGANGTLASTNVTLAAGSVFDVTAKAAFAPPASQTFELGLDSAGDGSAGRIVASSLDITGAAVSFSAAGTLDDRYYILATYTNLTGAAFASVSGRPTGYLIDYNFKGTKQIALVRSVGTLLSVR